MKMVAILSAALLMGATPLVIGQGTFVFDQQSSDESRILEGGGPFRGTIQSFTPTLDSVGFVRLYLMTADIDNAGVNLRAGSPTGPVLGTTSRLTLHSFYGPVTFLFDTPIGVTPGTTYYLEPVATVSGGSLLNASQFYNYPGGMIFSSNGTPSPTWDLWFREGIVVPEPATVSLTLVAGSLLLWLKRKGSMR
jgi:hypothetical protein